MIPDGSSEIRKGMVVSVTKQALTKSTIIALNFCACRHRLELKLLTIRANEWGWW